MFAYIRLTLLRHRNKSYKIVAKEVERLNQTIHTISHIIIDCGVSQMVPVLRLK